MKTVARVLLVVCSIAVPAAIGMGIYLYRNMAQIQQMKVELLSQQELQERLISGTPADRCLYPHTDCRVGFTLNPFMKQGTVWLDKGQAAYEINILGLRGPAIRPKGANVKRVLVVGDSWVWGWRVQEGDRLANQMQRLVDSRCKTGKYEFLTVAMPGWNVESEAAFLEDHIVQLEPDLVVWAVTQNDLADVAGVVPPGVLVDFVSPQNPSKPAFTQLGGWTNLPTPFPCRRWQRNIQLINQIITKYKCGVVAMIVDVYPIHFRMAADKVKPLFPVFWTPSKYRKDERFSFSRSDSHPSAWGTSIIALESLHELSKAGYLSGMEFTDDEKKILAEHDREISKSIGPADTAGYIAQFAQAVPLSHDPKTVRSFSIGLTAQGMVQKDGMCFLQVPHDRTKIVFQVRIDPKVLVASRRLTLAVRDVEGNEASVQATLDKPECIAEAPLPAPRSKHLLMEIEWSFDFQQFNSPSDGYSAKLVEITSRR